MESRAHPAPVAPPPMMITSYSSPLCSVFTCSERGGSFRLTRGVAIAAAFTFCWIENRINLNRFRIYLKKNIYIST